MSIHCYINDNYSIIPSNELVNINSYTEFENFIRQKLNISNTIYMHCLYQNSFIVLGNIMKSEPYEKKKDYDYLVFTENCSQYVSLYNLHSLVNNSYLLPKNITFDVFCKTFCSEKIKVFTKQQSFLTDKDCFLPDTRYYYKYEY